MRKKGCANLLEVSLSHLSGGKGQEEMFLFTSEFK